MKAYFQKIISNILSEKWVKIRWMIYGATLVSLITLGYQNAHLLKKLNFGSKQKFEFNVINPEFSQYISAFTTGYISSGSSIKIRFTSQLLESVPLNSALPDQYFSFSDDIEGETRWIDAQTIEFKPKNRLKAGANYKVKFFLHKLVDVKDDLKEFSFGFKVVDQSIKVELNDLKSYSNDDFSYYKYSGIVYTADYAENEKIEQILKAEYKNSKLKIDWSHDQKGITHQFSIDSIKRDLNDQQLNINWNASSIGLKNGDFKTIIIPAINKFTLLNVQVINQPDQLIQISFSNPLASDYSLDGLILFGRSQNFKYVIDNNLVKIYPNELRSGVYDLNINNTLQDSKGNKLDKIYESVVQFEEIKPMVNFVGKGVILPSSNQSSISFEAVNLKAVDVKIVKLFENNVLQFLQSGEITDEPYTARLGKKVLEKSINLGITNPADFKIKKKFMLDLSKLIETEPGAIYTVSLSFKKKYSTYSCNGESNDENVELEELIKPSLDDNGYGYQYENNDYDWENYDWEQRDNPCHPTYYQNYERKVSRNIIASDIGLTVKKGATGQLFFAAADLVTTTPIADLEIELYTYQQQLIETAKTNSEGLLFLQPKQEAYFVVAKNEKQRAYLKLDDYSILPLTLFDTEGEKIQKGVKGFLYTERAIWRPGDSIFISFVLEDKLKSLPLNIPVILELQNPQGVVYKKILKTKGMDGFYTFSLSTDADIPTGNWTANCKVGALEFSKSIRIETIMPNRLKLNISIGDNKIIKSNGVNNFSLNASWLTGAKVSDLKTNIEVTLFPIKTEFEKYSKYVFDDITQRYETENIDLFDGKLNKDGNLNLPFKINSKTTSAGLLKANIVTRVFEPGGTFSIDRFSMTYSPFKSYVGIAMPDNLDKTKILFTDQNHEFKIANVNENGQPITSNNIKIEVYKLDWRWWWDQYNDDLASFNASEMHQLVFTTNTVIKNGLGNFQLKVNQNDWGRYLIRAIDQESGHSTASVTYFDYPNWMERGGAENKIIANMLQFSTEKESYNTDEEIVVNIPTPKGGRALVTIETGSKVLEAHWLKTENGNTKYTFKAKPEMAPNIYVHVSLLQPHAQTQNDLPIRLYGVVKVKIDDPKTHLRPILTIPKELAPESRVKITVGEENNQDMTYTIAMVDEGLLDLTRFKTPDIWSNFYAKEALGIKTWDIYDQVIGAYGGELERILSIGGDGTEINKDGAKANRFKPMVKFMGPFHLKKGEKNSHYINMPMYIGSVRTMLIAGANGSYGSTEVTRQVKSPIMLLGTLPRVLGVNEKVNLPVSIFGGDKNLDNISVSIETNSLIQIIGNKNQTLNLKKNEEKLLNFDLKVKQITGIAKITINAVSGNKKTKYSLELDVRNPNPYRTDIKEFEIQPNKELTINYNGLGVSGTNTGFLELSSSPSINLESRVDYLVSYPYGCIEQMISAAFAQLNLSDMTTVSQSKKFEIDYNIKAAINSLTKFQLSDGSFSYWPADNVANEWGSIYATHFMFSAEKKGYSLPSNLKKKTLEYQSIMANNWINGSAANLKSDFCQAYRLYSLVVAGKPSIGGMNILRELATKTNQTKWMLASAYALNGNIEVAEKIINKMPSTSNKSYVDYYTFGSLERDEAIILEALCLMNKKSQSIAMMRKIASRLTSSQYLSTQSTSYSLIAAHTFIKKFGSGTAFQADINVNSQKVILEGNKAINIIPLTYISNKGDFKIKNNSKGIVFGKIVNKGKPANSITKVEESNIISKVIFKSQSNQIIDQAKLKQGTNFIMEISIKNTGMLGDLKNLALINYIPSGWEIHNTDLDGIDINSSSYDYQEIRDDKILTYFELKANESKTFKIYLNATYTGEFYQPGINIEAMYDNTVYSHQKGKWIKVVK